MRKMKTGAFILTICCVLTGCAVNIKPLTHEEIINRIAKDRESMYKDQEPLESEVSLAEAMARAIKYNLDNRLKIMEDAMSLRQLDLMTYDMLPRVVASAGYTQRDSENASSSTNVLTGQQSLAPSTSQDKGHANLDLNLTWNVLDFGVSYYQAKQQADRALIMRERRRKVIHNIMQQLRQTYWLALGAQQLEDRFGLLLKEVDIALQDVNRIDMEKLRAPIETLTYRKTLLEIIKQLETFRDELAQARPRLASLMNIPPGKDFRLTVPASWDIPRIPTSLEAMEDYALTLRPELIEADYNERISAYETRKAMARMLPGFELSLGGHYDSNSFLVNQQWLEGSARLSWNLLNILSGPKQLEITKNQTEIAKTQRLALSLAILTQVHVAYKDFTNRERQYELARQLQGVDAQIHTQTMNQSSTGAQSRLNEIRAATAALMAEYRRYQNYAVLQNAYGQMIATLGFDPLPETVAGHDVKSLTVAINTVTFPWQLPGIKSVQPANLPREKRP